MTAEPIPPELDPFSPDFNPTNIFENSPLVHLPEAANEAVNDITAVENVVRVAFDTSVDLEFTLMRQQIDFIDNNFQAAVQWFETELTNLAEGIAHTVGVATTLDVDHVWGALHSLTFRMHQSLEA